MILWPTIHTYIGVFLTLSPPSTTRCHIQKALIRIRRRVPGSKLFDIQTTYWPNLSDIEALWNVKQMRNLADDNLFVGLRVNPVFKWLLYSSYWISVMALGEIQGQLRIIQNVKSPFRISNNFSFVRFCRFYLQLNNRVRIMKNQSRMTVFTPWQSCNTAFYLKYILVPSVIFICSLRVEFKVV